MPVKRKQKSVLPLRRDDKLMTRDEPPLGSLQAKILKKLDLLKSEAFGYRVLVDLMQESQQYVDPAQVYTSIRKMLDKGYVEQTGTRAEGRGPPQKIYRLTEAGREALRITKEYHRSLSNYL